MFEKEAKEYLKKDGVKAEQILDMLNEISPLQITLKQLPFILAMIQQTFKDGAEFGYNKAFVEADKNLKAIVTDFNKAMNEAKGIIKDLLHCLPKENIEGVYEVAEEAERFIREVNKLAETTSLKEIKEK